MELNIKVASKNSTWLCLLKTVGLTNSFFPTFIPCREGEQGQGQPLSSPLQRREDKDKGKVSHFHPPAEKGGQGQGHAIQDGSH